MDKQQTMPCKATGSAVARPNARKRCAVYLALLTLSVALLSGCDASAQNITGAFKADAEARKEIASAQQTKAEADATLAYAERVKAEAVAETQREQMRQLDEANRRYAQAQESRVRDMQMTLLIFGVLLSFGTLGAGVLYVLWHMMNPRQYPYYPLSPYGPQPPSPAPQIVERIERQIIIIDPNTLQARGNLLRWGDVWIPREQLEGYVARCTGNEVQVWQEGR